MSKLLVSFLVLGIIGLVVGLSALGALLFQLLWNFAIATTFSAPKLSFLVAWAITVLIGFVTSGIRASAKS